MEKVKIIFIVNPISGSKSKANIPALINKLIDKNLYDHQIIFTDYAGQGSEIATLAIVNNVDTIVAVGGDGTVNEIGKVLIGSSVNLGIIPAGSGNGLARHMGIPMDTAKAIELFNNRKIIRIDAGQINEKPFFCTAGVGFDAHIGNIFLTKVTRGLKGYITSTIKEFFSYIPEVYTVKFNEKVIKQQAFLVTFANASQYGNNAYIAPNAKIDDQYLDVCILNKFPLYAGPGIGMRIFAKNIDRSSYLNSWKVKSVSLERVSPGVIHLDGEPIQMGKLLKVNCIPSCLNVVVRK